MDKSYNFEFLKPTSEHFGYFSGLIEQYSKIINEPGSEFLDKLSSYLDDKSGLENILSNANDRLKWRRYQTESTKLFEKEIVPD